MPKIANAMSPFDAMFFTPIAQEARMPDTRLPADLESGVPVIDQLHRDFLQALGHLCVTPDCEFIGRYQHFVQQTEEAFRQEEEWMELLDLQIIKSHREQHARVLGALHHVYSRLLDGDLAVGREVVKRLLPRWFMLHISTMDAALALAIQRASADANDLKSAR